MVEVTQLKPSDCIAKNKLKHDLMKLKLPQLDDMPLLLQEAFFVKRLFLPSCVQGNVCQPQRGNWVPVRGKGCTGCWSYVKRQEACQDWLCSTKEASWSSKCSIRSSPDTTPQLEHKPECYSGGILFWLDVPSSLCHISNPYGARHVFPFPFHVSELLLGGWKQEHAPTTALSQQVRYGVYALVCCPDLCDGYAVHVFVFLFTFTSWSL